LLARPPAAAGGLSDLLQTPRLARLGLAPLGPALASTVAATYPVGSASSSAVWAYNPRLDTLERKQGPDGPIIGERAETVRQGELELGVGYSWVRLASIDGRDLDQLVNRPVVDGRSVVFPVKGGVVLRDGRFSSFLPVRVALDLGVEAHIVTPSATYGVTPDLDLNLSLPVVRTSLDLTADTITPDPRLPAFVRQDGVRTAARLDFSDEATGVGDLLLRAKQVVWRGPRLDVAAGLGLSLPTGSQSDLHGRGTVLVTPMLIGSTVLGDRFEPLLNVGIDCDAERAERSAVRWALGSTAWVAGPLTAALVFLGRHELAAPADRIPAPFFFQIQRSDVVDASVGFRWRFSDAWNVALNALVPLGRDGLRAEVVPTLQVDYGFKLPR
jgi:hypothetical protein